MLLSVVSGENKNVLPTLSSSSTACTDYYYHTDCTVNECCGITADCDTDCTDPNTLDPAYQTYEYPFSGAAGDYTDLYYCFDSQLDKVREVDADGLTSVVYKFTCQYDVDCLGPATVDG